VPAFTGPLREAPRRTCHVRRNRKGQRLFNCGECARIMDRDENAARNLAALAAACSTGTGVAGDRDAQASKPRGAGQKTRTTQPSRKDGPGRAGGATLLHQR
jgi:putative transposase